MDGRGTGHMDGPGMEHTDASGMGHTDGPGMGHMDAPGTGIGSCTRDGTHGWSRDWTHGWNRDRHMQLHDGQDTGLYWGQGHVARLGTGTERCTRRGDMRPQCEQGHVAAPGTGTRGRAGDRAKNCTGDRAHPAVAPPPSPGAGPCWDPLGAGANRGPQTPPAHPHARWPAGLGGQRGGPSAPSRTQGTGGSGDSTVPPQLAAPREEPPANPRPNALQKPWGAANEHGGRGDGLAAKEGPWLLSPSVGLGTLPAPGRIQLAPGAGWVAGAWGPQGTECPRPVSWLRVLWGLPVLPGSARIPASLMDLCPHVPMIRCPRVPVSP